MSIKKGDKVKIDYEGTLEDGTVFDSTEKQGKPAELEIGTGQLIPGVDKALVGMKKGEEKTIKLGPEDAYGEPKPELMKEVPRENLGIDDELEPGMVLMLTMPNGMQFAALVVEVSGEKVTIDLNHPLAGKTLIFKVKIVDIVS